MRFNDNENDIEKCDRINTFSFETKDEAILFFHYLIYKQTRYDDANSRVIKESLNSNYYWGLLRTWDKERTYYCIMQLVELKTPDED